MANVLVNVKPHLPHPPPPIGGGLGPPPKFILPIRLRPPGGPGGLHERKQCKMRLQIFDFRTMSWLLSTIWVKQYDEIVKYSLS